MFSIEPKRGIKSGGTVVRIIGHHLTCSTNLAIKFTAFNTECTILNITTMPRDQLPYSMGDEDLEPSSDMFDLIYCRTPSIPLNQKHSIQLSTEIELKMDDYTQKLDEHLFKFEYLDDPLIIRIEPERCIASGGLNLTIHGRDFDHLQSTHLILSSLPLTTMNQRSLHTLNNNNIFRSECFIRSGNLIDCPIPQIRDQRVLSGDKSVEYSLYIEFNRLGTRFLMLNNQLQRKLLVFPDPKFDADQIFTDKTPIILIKGQNLLQAARENDYLVLLMDEAGILLDECNMTSITNNMIACILPDFAQNYSTSPDYIQINRIRNKRDDLANQIGQVRVKLGRNFDHKIGHIRFEKQLKLHSSLRSKYYELFEMKFIIIAACSISFVLFSTMIACFVVLRRRQNKQIRQLKRMQNEFENLEMRVARECKEAFTELQMDIGELVQTTLNQTGAPFNDFETYCIKILFPNANESEKFFLKHPSIMTLNHDNMKNGLSMLSHLLLNKKFLLNFIHTLESDTQNFLLNDRVQLASYLSICLYDKFDYFTDILLTLLSELIEKVVVSGKTNPKILFRRNESIAEKMLANWFAFLLYDFIRDCAGTPLYILFLSIKQQIYKGPVDAITCEARYSLSEDKLIRQSIDYESMIIRVQLQDMNDLTHEISVKVLNCDTITQVKEKILDSFFKGYPYTKRPRVNELDLVYVPNDWMQSKSGKMILHDEDRSCKIDSDDFKKFNTLAHYKISNGALFYLIPSQNDTLSDPLVNRNAENMTLLSKSSKSSSSPPTYSKLSPNSSTDTGNNGIYSIMNGSTIGLTEAAYSKNYSNYFNPHSKLDTMNLKNQAGKSAAHKKYHLIKPSDAFLSTKNEDITAKLVSEVYLTRLLATKGGMQSFVDDFFESVFSTAHGSNVLPFAIKYLFDFLDDQAAHHGIQDPDVVYTWKSNALPLRFWVNIIKNPDFVFDIHKSNIVDASLSVIASTFMDSCSQSKLDLNKESPSGKLLFYKEVHKYRKWVESYYSEIRQMPRISEQDLGEMLTQESRVSIF